MDITPSNAYRTTTPSNGYRTLEKLGDTGRTEACLTLSHLSEVLERGHQKEPFQIQQKSKIGAKKQGKFGGASTPKKKCERNQMPPEAATINSVAVTAFLCVPYCLCCV